MIKVLATFWFLFWKVNFYQCSIDLKPLEHNNLCGVISRYRSVSHLVSSIQHLPSSIRYLLSSIEHPARIPHPGSRISHRLSLHLPQIFLTLRFIFQNKGLRRLPAKFLINVFLLYEKVARHTIDYYTLLYTYPVYLLRGR